MLPNDRLRVLDRTGIDYEVIIDDVQSLLDAEQARLTANQNGIAGVGYHEEYHQQDEIFAFYDALQAGRPDLMTSRVIGQTIEGRDIPAYTIFGGEPEDLADAPAVYILTGAHAREWIGPATIAFVVDNLINSHGIDDRITSLVDGVVWHIVPIANPDGYQHTWDDNRLWRKTRRPTETARSAWIGIEISPPDGAVPDPVETPTATPIAAARPSVNRRPRRSRRRHGPVQLRRLLRCALLFTTDPLALRIRRH